jgi:hypothetical protein
MQYAELLGRKISSTFGSNLVVPVTEIDLKVLM